MNVERPIARVHLEDLSRRPSYTNSLRVYDVASAVTIGSKIRDNVFELVESAQRDFSPPHLLDSER